MKFVLPLVIAVGVLIGLAFPDSRRGAAPLAPAAVAARPAAPPVALSRDTVLERSGNGHFFTVADVNGEPIRFVVDTGATIVALTEEDARRAGVRFDPGRYEMVGMGASGALRGQVVDLDTLSLDGKQVDRLRALVIAGLPVSLLGQNYLSHVDMTVSGDRMTLK